MSELQTIPQAWDADRAAAELQKRGFAIKGPTIENERRAGRISSIPVGKRHYYTEAIVLEYLNSLVVHACLAKSRKGSASLETGGSPSIPSVQTGSGAEPGTIPEHVKLAVSALEQQTFGRRRKA